MNREYTFMRRIAILLSLMLAGTDVVAIAGEVGQTEAIKIANEYMVGNGYTENPATLSPDKLDIGPHERSLSIEGILKQRHGSVDPSPYKVFKGRALWHVVYRQKQRPDLGWVANVEKESGKVAWLGLTSLRPPTQRVTREEAVAIAAGEIVRTRAGDKWLSELQVDVQENRSRYAKLSEKNPSTYPDYGAQLKGRSYWSVYFYPFGETLGGDAEITVDQQTGEVIFAVFGQ